MSVRTIGLALTCLQLTIALNSVMDARWTAGHLQAFHPETHWVEVFSVTEFSWLLVVPALAWFVASPCFHARTIVLRGSVTLLCVLVTTLFVTGPVDHMNYAEVSAAHASLSYLDAVEHQLSVHAAPNWTNLLVGLVWPTGLVHLAYLLGAGFALRFWIQVTEARRRVELLERNLAEARYQVLCSRTQPHFLMNALNTISALTITDTEAARDAIGRLGSLLKFSLDTTDHAQVSLRREYELVSDYLHLQRARFGEELEFELQLDRAAEAASVPSFLLQPLVENAIKHGLGARDLSDGPFRLSLSAQVEDGRVCVRVEDNGNARPDLDTDSDDHLGMRLVGSRLEQFFGDTASFEFSPRPDRGFEVTLCFPLQVGEARS